MTANAESAYATCGAALPAQQRLASSSSQPTSTPQSDREYDRRGTLLPQRTRVGGIITPQ